jgi:thiaminase/transcriptional activator TenA
MIDGDSDGTAVPERYEQYRTGQAAPRFTTWLRERSEPGWTNATTHRFTRELGADELADDVFRRYLVQDYSFLETLVGVFGYAVGEAPGMAAKARHVEFLATLTADEDEYFARSFEALGVPESDYENPVLTPTTRALEDLLERAAREGGYAETLAVLLPAEWIYLEWAAAVSDRTPTRFYLAEWIDLHAGAAFADFVGWLRTELDREGAAASARRRARLEALFCRTVESEVAFFEAAYDPERSSPASLRG